MVRGVFKKRKGKSLSFVATKQQNKQKTFTYEHQNTHSANIKKNV